MPIRVLPEEVATRIAAGEVVERPASVIKELIENAIDAGAGEIRLEIQGGGQQKMRVLDDGCGIPADEVELAFARHSTSKLAAVDDLECIRTLGFRGEALASIAAVSRVTLVTRAKDEPVGTLLRLEGGQVVAREPSGRPPGAAITVSDLFFNLPARRKFLRNERTERRHIDVLVTRYAMAYPHVRFSLAHEGRVTFQSHGSGDLRQVLLSVYGANHATQMIEVAGTDAPGEIRVSGYASRPSLQRSNRNEITLLVNGRWVQDQSLTFAVVQAYHTLLMTGRHPLAVIRVDLRPEDVDVNVHPAKTQVRFRDGDAVFRAVQRAVRRALLDQASAPELQTDAVPAQVTPAEAAPNPDWPGAWPTPEQMVRRARLRALGAQAPPSGPATATTTTQFSLPLPRTTPAGPPTPHTEPQSTLRAEPQDEANSQSAARSLPFLRVVGQLGLTYIIAEGPEGMFLIDQHAAHERVLFEKFLAEKEQARVASQALLEPVTVELTPEGAGLVEENLEALLALGFDAVAFGGHTVLLRAVPALLADTDPQSVLDEIVADLQVGDDPLASEMEGRIVRRVCKQVAIKAGQALSRPEMEALVRQLEACASPRTCPHGRPTMIHLSAMQLAQEFGRLG